MKLFLCFFFLYSFVSCSSIRFQNTGLIPVMREVEIKTAELFSIKGELIYYAWGGYPLEHILNIDEEFKKEGVSYVFDPRLEEYQTFFNGLITIFTFGMYQPRNYRLTAYVIKEKDRYDF